MSETFELVPGDSTDNWCRWCSRPFARSATVVKQLRAEEDRAELGEWEYLHQACRVEAERDEQPVYLSAVARAILRDLIGRTAPAQPGPEWAELVKAFTE